MTRGKSRMRSFRMYGSVRGAEGNLCPYRNPSALDDKLVLAERKRGQFEDLFKTLRH